MIAEVAVATGIPPQFLMDDQWMLLEIINVLQERSEAERKAARG